MHMCVSNCFCLGFAMHSYGGAFAWSLQFAFLWRSFCLEFAICIPMEELLLGVCNLHSYGGAFAWSLQFAFLWRSFCLEFAICIPMEELLLGVCNLHSYGGAFAWKHLLAFMHTSLNNDNALLALNWWYMRLWVVANSCEQLRVRHDTKTNIFIYTDTCINITSSI